MPSGKGDRRLPVPCSLHVCPLVPPKSWKQLHSQARFETLAGPVPEEIPQKVTITFRLTSMLFSIAGRSRVPTISSLLKSTLPSQEETLNSIQAFRRTGRKRRFFPGDAECYWIEKGNAKGRTEIR